MSWVKIDDWENPSPNLKPDYLVMNDKDSPVLCIPKGYANGLKALEEHSKILVFSEFELEKSINEKIRFDSNLWLDWELF